MIITIAQYYFDLIKIEFYTVNNNYLYIQQMETKFIEFCENGNLDNIKQLINSHEINIHAKNEEGFRWACENGQGKERRSLSFAY